MGHRPPRRRRTASAGGKSRRARAELRDAAEAVGAAASRWDRTVEYVRHREQFGRAIGSFQAVGHRPGSGRGGPGARPVSGGGTGVVKAEAVQLHGGIGFIREHGTRPPFARAASDGPPFGPVHALRARSAEPAGLFTGTCARLGGAREAVPAAPGDTGEAAR